MTISDENGQILLDKLSTCLYVVRFVILYNHNDSLKMLLYPALRGFSKVTENIAQDGFEVQFFKS